MPKQRTLPLNGQEALDTLWRHFPEEGRRKAIEIYARLMALAVRGEHRKEKDSDQPQD